MLSARQGSLGWDCFSCSGGDARNVSQLWEEDREEAGLFETYFGNLSGEYSMKI